MGQEGRGEAAQVILVRSSVGEVIEILAVLHAARKWPEQ